MNRTRKIGTVAALLVILFFAGFGIGSLISKTMKTSAKAAKGYIERPEAGIAEGGVMTPETLLALGRLSDPQLSPDGKKILYGVSYNSVKDNRSCRQIFLCDLDDGNKRIQLSRFSSSVSNARWSADGQWIYFLQEGQLYRAPLKGCRLGRRELLSNVPAGISEFKLSPDEANILYTSTIKNPSVQQPADSDPVLDKAGAYATEDLMYRHWDHWVTEIPRSFVSSMGNGLITPDSSFDILGNALWELPTEPFGGIEQLDWSPDGRYIAYSCRKLRGKQYAFSTCSNIYIYDIVTGSEIALTTSGGYDTDPVWSHDGMRLAWISMERDGYEADAQRLMVADIARPEAPSDGQAFGLEVCGIRQLASSLDRDAAGIFWTPDDSGIVFNALTDGIQALYIVEVGTDRLTRLTSEDEKQDFFSPFAFLPGQDEGFRLLGSSYSLLRPVELIAIDFEDDLSYAVSPVTDENGYIFSQLDSPTTESIWLETVDGKQMQCWVMYPPQFDPGKVYPAIEIVLGGPQGTNSQDWSYRWCYRLMAQQGYIIIMPNRRGTTAFGQEWKEQISGDYSGLNMQDYLTAGRYMKSLPYVSKLACVGASYGGYSAYMLEGLHGDIFDCFIAHAGIFDEKQLWFTTEEMWFANWDNGGLLEYAYTPGQTGPAGDGITFGGMQQAGAPYASTPKAQHHYATSPSSMVTKWHTPILCIHGGMDFRIPYEQGMAAFNAAQMMGVPSKLVVFPEENHWILQPQNAIYWYRTFFDWLERWM